MLNEAHKSNQALLLAYDIGKVFLFVYLFLISIDLMGASFKLAGSGFAGALLKTTENPFIALILGIVSTSIVQSSSTTTSIVVAMVGAGSLTLNNAIPIVMGANIGTTVTCTIVSFGYIGRKTEFERSFSASIIHDIFNISATIILFPLELWTGLIHRSATVLVTGFQDIGGFQFVSPLKYVIAPITGFLVKQIGNHYLLLAVAIALLIFSLSNIVKSMKGIVMEKIESVLNQYLFRNAFISMILGCGFTAIVQSSSIATSILVPLVGAGLLTIEQVFPYTLGANVGTTITAILAALTIGLAPAMAVAFSHLLFNLFGIMLIYPVRRFPIRLARTLAHYVAASKKHFFIFLSVFILFHFIPIILAVFH